MLKKRENPTLFNVLKTKLKNIYSHSNNDSVLKGFSKNIDDSVLTNEQLSEIKYLIIDWEDDVQNLYGIEKCVNLEYFYHSGLYPYAVTEDEGKGSGFASNQVIDLSPLYECKKLENLNLSDQRNITDINFARWKNLQEAALVGCSNLKNVFGIDKFLKNCNLENKIMFDFGDCYALDNISHFEKILKIIDEKNLTQNEIQIILPTFTYFKLSRQKEFKNITQLLKKIENKENSKKVILWSENQYSPLEEVYHLSSQMELTNKYLDEILNNLFEKYNPILKLEKMALVYDWIIKNVYYDDEGIIEEENYLNFQGPITASMRSSFVALWEKRAVCVGYANLLTAFCCKLGIDARPINVECLDENQMQAGNPNHVITSIKTKQGVYYCDATSRNFDDFMMNEEETMEKKISLPLSRDVLGNAPSLKNKIKNYVDNAILNDKCKENNEKYKRAIIKSFRRIKNIVNLNFYGEFSKLSTEEKENAINMAKQMREERLRLE